MNKFYFFGAGKKGRYWLEFFKDFGIAPDGFIDNNQDSWGKQCEEIMTFSPDLLQTSGFGHVFITCNDEKVICQQLITLGVNNDQIVFGNHNIFNHMLYYVAKHLAFTENRVDSYCKDAERKVVMDLQNGLVLGGVESWVYDLAKWLKENSYQGLYFTTDAGKVMISDTTYPVCMLKYQGVLEEKDKIKICIQSIIKNFPCSIICNFPQYTFWSACIVKQLYPNRVRIIAVQHSDDPVYYETYGLWQEFVDQYMVISTRMEQKLILCGVRPEQIGRLEWQISCKENLNKTWDCTDRRLQIGYAGRVTTVSKRVDLLVLLAEKLQDRNIDFQINVVGTGDYSEILQQRIQDNNLQKYIILNGYIDRKDIPDFWNKQDIMISCSELEGHSISQSEAMAEGAVPVITDVSGARDDVTDGYNGYIVDVGDIDTMADRIAYLYHNREELEQMGRHAHKTIYERQQNADQAKFWDNLIKKVWQE